MGNDCIEELNKKHAVIMVAGKALILNEVRDPIFGTDLALTYSNGIPFPKLEDFL